MNWSWLVPSLKSDYRQATRYLEHLSGWPEQEVRAMQLERVQAVWADAVVDVPFYRRLVEMDRAPRTIQSWGDFRSIPMMDKLTYRRHETEFARLSGPAGGYLQTAGATGNPIRFGVWNNEGQSNRIAKLALWISQGYTPGSELLLIWGHSHLLGAGWRRRFNTAKRILKDKCLGYLRINAYTLGPQTCEHIADLIIRHKPVGIIGYAVALDLVGRAIVHHREDLRRAGVRFVLSTAEMPPKPDSLTMLADLFDATVVQEFGGVDFGNAAMKIGNDAWRSFPDLNILEAADYRDDDGGQPVTITPLYRRYTPFIRYRQGDLIDGVHRMQHGHVDRFDRLVGRVDDAVVMNDGRRVHSVALQHCVNPELAVLSIQLLLQDGGMRLRLVVRGESPNPEMEARIRTRLATIHPELKKAPIDYVPDLQTNAAGKRRWIVDERTQRPDPASA